MAIVLHSVLLEWRRNETTMKEMTGRNRMYVIIVAVLGVANNIRKAMYHVVFLLKKLRMLCLPPSRYNHQ